LSAAGVLATISIMSKEMKWRFISDYVGAGSYILDSAKAVVGTPYGLHSLTRRPRRHTQWRLDLGSRCLGVRELEGGALLATCRGGLFLVSSSGALERARRFPGPIVHAAVPFHDGWVVTEGTRVQFSRGWEGESEWAFDLRETLGEAVASVRPVDLVQTGDFLVAGLVDYDSGLGRVHVLDRHGKAHWVSELEPISDLFRAGEGSFVWCLTGYDKFESRLTNLGGKDIWRQDFAGIGIACPDGSIAMLVGSNESPQWDNWACRHVSAVGKLLSSVEATGRVAARPVCGEDGAIYFIGSSAYIDPSSSRVDYTSFIRPPQELRFQHLTGMRQLLPEFDVYLQRVRSPEAKPEVLHHIQGSFSIARPRVREGEVLFCDGTDIVAVER
jgi:hypothetical protein